MLKAITDFLLVLKRKAPSFGAFLFLRNMRFELQLGLPNIQFIILLHEERLGFILFEPLVGVFISSFFLIK